MYSMLARCYVCFVVVVLGNTTILTSCTDTHIVHSNSHHLDPPYHKCQYKRCTWSVVRICTLNILINQMHAAD